MLVHLAFHRTQPTLIRIDLSGSQAESSMEQRSRKLAILPTRNLRVCHSANNLVELSRHRGSCNSPIPSVRSNYKLAIGIGILPGAERSSNSLFARSSIANFHHQPLREGAISITVQLVSSTGSQSCSYPPFGETSSAGVASITWPSRGCVAILRGPACHMLRRNRIILRAACTRAG